MTDDNAFRNAFEDDAAAVGGSIEELSAQAETEAALQAERDERDAAVSESDPQDEPLKAFADGDENFFTATHIMTEIMNAVADLRHQLYHLRNEGELAETVCNRELVLTLEQRILVFAGLQIFGTIAPGWREELEELLTLFETLAQPTPEEEELLVEAEAKLKVWATELMTETILEQYPGVSVYTPEEFEREMQNPDTEDPHIKALQQQQDAGLN